MGEIKNQPQISAKENDGDTEDSEVDQNVGNDDMDDHDMLPAYKTIPSSHSSPQVTMQGAIALINRYIHIYFDT